MIKDKQLTYALIKQEEATAKDIDRMFQLMQSHYTHVTETMFLNDLSQKHFIGVIRDNNTTTIQGFTTFAINPRQCAGKKYNVLFSGDTIIDRNYWGSQIMMKGWCMSAGAIVASDEFKPWYWYLMSKGHRTYLYLPLFFHKYYPSLQPFPGHEKLLSVADEVSQALFGADWKPKKGVIKFKQHHGAMRPELYSSVFKKESNRHVKFFLEKNPGFSKGDELVCLAPIQLENMKRSAKDYLREGMRQPLEPKEQTQ